MLCLMRLSGAQMEFVKADEIGPAMDQSMIELKALGYNPYYLYGGGHTRAGGESLCRCSS